MNKTLLIVIILVIVVVIGFLAVKFLGGELSSPMGGESLIDMAKKQGKEVPSEKEWIKGCEESDPDARDDCYSMGAFYYRDTDLCKNIKDPEIKKECTKEKIEEYYKLLEEGSGAIPGMPGILPDISEEDEEGAGEETGSSEENNPIMDKNIEDISQKEMVEYCQQQVNETVAGTRMYLRDACFHQVAVHFRNSELCNYIEVTNDSMGGENITTKKKCLESVENFSGKWNAMQGKIGKMNEALYVEISAQTQCHTLAGSSDLEAYMKWLDEWSKWINNEFGVTAEEYKLYSEGMEDDDLFAMNLGIRVVNRTNEICPY